MNHISCVDKLMKQLREECDNFGVGCELEAIFFTGTHTKKYLWSLTSLKKV